MADLGQVEEGEGFDGGDGVVSQVQGLEVDELWLGDFSKDGRVLVVVYLFSGEVPIHRAIPWIYRAKWKNSLANRSLNFLSPILDAKKT